MCGWSALLILPHFTYKSYEKRTVKPNYFIFIEYLKIGGREGGGGREGDPPLDRAVSIEWALFSDSV